MLRVCGPEMLCACGFVPREELGRKQILDLDTRGVTLCPRSYQQCDLESTYKFNNFVLENQFLEEDLPRD